MAAATSAAPDEKKRRYDRQLRLWGEHGQAAMEDCSICLINGSASGSETLKNLVLPGACMCHIPLHLAKPLGDDRPHPNLQALAPSPSSMVPL